MVDVDVSVSQSVNKVTGLKDENTHTEKRSRCETMDDAPLDKKSYD